VASWPNIQHVQQIYFHLVMEL
ncbi:hypothetical protein CCACVL1_01441, partial [Corchorus capsularis]